MYKEYDFEDFQLVWWIECSTQRLLCFWDKRHNKHFHDLGLRTKGPTKGTYEAYKGDYPEWAKIAQQELITSNKLADENSLCWKFANSASNGGDAGYSICTCNPLQDRLESEERVRKDLERRNWLMDNVIKR